MINTKYYSFSVDENSIQIKYTGKHKDEIVSDVVWSLVGGLLQLFISIFFFVYKLFPHAVMFLFFSVYVFAYLIHRTNEDFSRRKATKYVLNNFGIEHKEIKASYHLNWADVQCWGFINNNIIRGKKNPYYPKQVCLYFSKNPCTERFLDHKLFRIENKSRMYFRPKEMIVLGFKENEVDKSIIDAITTFVNSRIESSKNQNFWREEVKDK